MTLGRISVIFEYNKTMVITRNNDSIIITPGDGINMDAVQQLIDYINVLEIAANKKGTEEEAAEMANEVNNNWWKSNKHRFLK